MKRLSVIRILVSLTIALFCYKPILAQAPIRVDLGYEDSVRIVILWNNPQGNCGWMPPVGQQTKDSVLKSISGGHLGNLLLTPNPNVVVLPTLSTTWANIQAIWPGKLPHVIVHINAGWGDQNFNGDPQNGTLANVFLNATQNYVGVVEIGDDASWMAINTFGLTLTNNMPPPIGDGTQYTLATDTMFVGMYPKRDTLMDSTKYPYLNGIVRNASNLINNGANAAYRNTLFFKPYNPNGLTDTIRCQADADQYTVNPAQQNKLLFLGFQEASRNGVRQVSPNYPELDVVVAFQDTIHIGNSTTIRRAVALSMEPQFLKNGNSAVNQLVYDAIMFASLAWQLKPIGKIEIQVKDSVLHAGDTTTVTAILYRDNKPDTSKIKDSVTWKLDPATKQTGDWIYGNISANKGQKLKVSATKAYRYVDIIAQYTDSSTRPPILVLDTAHIYVLPGPEYRVVIVGATDTSRTAANQNTLRPLDKITLDGATNFDTVFAVTYDMFNNWVGKANTAAWLSLKPNVVNAEAVPTKNFQGALHRMTKDTDFSFVVASQTGLISDSCMVVLQTGFVTDIRVVDVNGNQVDSVGMTTDDKKLLRIQVKWSNDTSKWVYNGGSWTLSPPNAIGWVNNPPAGNQTDNWNLDPTSPGKTILIVSAGNKSDTLPLVISPADPNQVTLKILTPKDSLIAGDTILIQQQIKNTDGLVPGPWCGQAAYLDKFDNSKKPNWPPSITIPGKADATVIGLSQNGEVCFQNGIDTIKVVLYAAPYFSADSVHQLSIILPTKIAPNGLKASTDPFNLLPGPLDSISIEDANYLAIPGPITLNYPGDMKFFYSNGYDHYQNLIGHVNTNWTQTGSLHPIPAPKDTTYRILYEAADANEQGFIFTRVQSILRPDVTLYDSVEVINNGSQAVLDSAVTKDANGNGYLDHVVLYFNKPIIMNGDDVKASTVLRYSGTTFTIDSIRNISQDNTIYSIALHDPDNTGAGVLTKDAPPPQTSWRPVLNMNNLPGGVKVANFKCKDGAGPVIWKVLVNRNSAEDRTKDFVTVTFSESIEDGKTGEPFKASTVLPSSVFTVWSKASGSFVKVDSALLKNGALEAPIFSPMTNDTSLSFYMRNARELFKHYYFNIISDNSASNISDRANAKLSNIPVQNNQKVQVEILGAPGILTIGPNPLTPTPTNGGPEGRINFRNTPQAVNWVLNNGGAIFRISISPGQGTMTGYLRVYDVAGNLVNYGENQENMFAEFQGVKDTSSIYNYDIYWNGTNNSGMLCAPGAYLGVLYLTTTKNTGSTTTRQAQKVGVARYETKPKPVSHR